MRQLSYTLHEKVWGSVNTEPWLPPTGKKIGEAWFEKVEEIPLLIKLLFTTEKLSVQVHPADDYAQKHHNSPGKTEMWHILAAEPGAKIAAGLRESLTPERLREASLSGEIMDLLAWHDAKPGDTFFIPAGTVHAIGEGLTLLEVQQYSDVTYRLYDYGRPRELHLDHGCAVSCTEPYDPRVQIPFSCPYFAIDRRSSAPEAIFISPSSGTASLDPSGANDELAVWIP